MEENAHNGCQQPSDHNPQDNGNSANGTPAHPDIICSAPGEGHTDFQDVQSENGVEDTDHALRLLGRYSRWQVRGYLTYAVGFMVPFAAMATAIIFIGDTPGHNCSVPPGSILNDTIPWEKRVGEWQRSQCEMYQNKTKDNTTIPCTHGYWYDPESGYHSTIVTQWDLVCGKNWLVEFSMTLSDIGSTVGVLIFSSLADRVGRKPVFLACIWSNFVVMVIQAFSPNMLAFSVFSFIDGLQKQGMLVTVVVLGLEIFPTDQRTMAGTVIQFFWAAGYIMLAPLAYFLRSWHHLQLALISPWAFSFLFYWWLPESIPWLVTNRKKEKAEEMLQEAARFNRISIPENIFSTDEIEEQRVSSPGEEYETLYPTSCSQIFSKAYYVKCWEKWQNSRKNTAKYDYGTMDLMRSPVLRIYIICMIYIWFTNNLAYRGLNLTVTSLSGNRYLNYFLYGLVEIPAYAATWWSLEKIGRIKPLCAFHLLGGAALIATVIQTSESNIYVEPLVTIFTMIGKFAISASYAVIFCNSLEMFPTNIRNTAFGLCHFSARIAGYISPYFRILAQHYSWAPQVILGLLSVGAGFVALLLPETRTTHLPDTVEEVERWHREKKYKKTTHYHPENNQYDQATTAV